MVTKRSAVGPPCPAAVCLAPVARARTPKEAPPPHACIFFPCLRARWRRVCTVLWPRGHGVLSRGCDAPMLCRAIIPSKSDNRQRIFGCLSRSTAGRHHKAADTLADRNVITRLFYGCYPFFAFCCVGTELFYVALYLLVFVPGASFELGAGLAVSLHAVSLKGKT